MSPEKPVVLLCWGYNRPSWVQFFEQLNDHFSFVYLFFMHPDEEDACFTQNKRIYYTQYKSPKELLADIRPSKIVFMGLDGLQPIAVNIQGKKDGIPTYFMMHGSATLDFEDYRNFVFEKRNIIQESVSRKAADWIFTFRFLLQALGWKALSKLPILLRYQIQKLRQHPILALKQNKTPLRNPDKYIVFSEKDIAFYVEQDNADAADFFVIGNLEITGFVEYHQKQPAFTGGYLLYIETPISEIENNEFSNIIISKEENVLLIEQLSQYAKKQGLKLHVKLHPYTYNTSYYPQDANIIYFRDCNKEELILGADLVVFYNSSLSVPALLYKKCLMFQIGQLDGYQKNIAETGVCRVIDYKKILEGDPDLFDFDVDSQSRNNFIKTFIGENIDGNGLVRLKNILETKP